jgi:type I restriction enzyme S subunit
MCDLPDGWEWRRTDEVGDVQLGRQRSPSHATGPYMRPYLRVANVFDGHIDYSDVLEMNFTPSEFKIFSLRVGDILLNEGQSLELVGRNAVYDGLPEMCFQNTLVRFRPRLVTSEFAQAVFKHWFDNGVFRRIARQTTSIAHLGADRFSALPFPLPSLWEQQRLSEIIDSIDSRASRAEAILSKQRNFSAAIAQQLIPVRPDPSMLGDGWRLAALAEFVPSVDYGISTPLVYGDNGLPTLRMNNLIGGKIGVDDVKISVDPVPDRLILNDGDVLFNRTNSFEHVGRTAVWRSELERATFASYLVRLNLDLCKITPGYIVRWLSRPAIRQRIRRLATPGVHQVNINPTSLRKTLVELPEDISKQQEIVAVLDECDRTINSAQIELQRLRDLRQGLLDDLLIGRVRVSVGL